MFRLQEAAYVIHEVDIDVIGFSFNQIVLRLIHSNTQLIYHS